MFLDLSLHASAPEPARAELGHRKDARRRDRRMPPEGGRRGTRQRRGGRPRGAGRIQAVGVTCIRSAEAWSAAAVDIISALGSRLSALGSRLSALGSRLSALGSRLSALGSRLSALGSRLSALGSRLSALGSRLSALGSRLSALGSRLSALGSRLSALGSRLSALGSLLIASSEFAPDAPSCGVRTAAGDCAAAGARPSTSCRSMRIDIRPFGESEESIFDPHGHIINRNVQNPPPTTTHRQSARHRPRPGLTPNPSGSSPYGIRLHQGTEPRAPQESARRLMDVWRVALGLALNRHRRLPKLSTMAR